MLAELARALGVEDTAPARLSASLHDIPSSTGLCCLLLDNFEHLLEAARDVAKLLAGAPSLRVLATSRRPLHIRAELCYELDPLCPEDATSLFVERVRAKALGFDPTAADGHVIDRICERVDRLPLAIELTAARADVVDGTLVLPSLDALLQAGGSFRDLPGRQRTLWATIDWSYRLLADDDRRLLGRLSIFRGPFTLEAATAVCGADKNALAELLDARVLGRRGDRFAMLETIRDFAATRLEPHEREELLRRHAQFFLASRGKRGRD